MPVKILAVTGGRADWGLLSPVLKAIKADPHFTLSIAATGQHFTNDSASLKAIESEGFTVAAEVDLGLAGANDRRGVTRAMGQSVSGFADVLANLSPDLLLVLGDRYEILGAVSAALIARVPVAHLCGGDVSEGAFDDSIRHAMTKMSHIHFVTNEDARKRVLQMGEAPSAVHLTGSPGLDNIVRGPFMARDDFFAALGFAPRDKNLLVTFHPVTLEEDSQEQCRAMLDALHSLGPQTGLILTGSNADPEGQAITALLSAFAQSHENAVFRESLGTPLYLNALKHCDAMVGNSSSGLYEAPSLSLPAINIGNRQKGRLKASSVVDVAPEKGAIKDAIERALAAGRPAVQSPYGDGQASARIVSVLKGIADYPALCKKSFRMT